MSKSGVAIRSPAIYKTIRRCRVMGESYSHAPENICGAGGERTRRERSARPGAEWRRFFRPQLRASRSRKFRWRRQSIKDPKDELLETAFSFAWSSIMYFIEMYTGLDHTIGFLVLHSIFTKSGGCEAVDSLPWSSLASSNPRSLVERKFPAAVKLGAASGQRRSPLPHPPKA